MSETPQFLIEHGYLVLFVWTLGEQLGVPVPAVPVLLAAGALAGMGRLDLATATLVATTASILSDGIWYVIGRVRGGRVLSFLCRIALEPTSCVRRTENMFGRYGGRSLLVAKFVPGLNTVAPPMAGITRMRPSRFLLLDGLGSLLYVGTFVLLGFVFAAQLEAVAGAVAGLGRWGVLLLVGALVGYILVKYVERQRFVRELRIARITPEELKERLDRGEDVVVVDLRHSIDFEASPATIPGALRIAPDEIERDHHRIPRDREIVLFCT